MVYTFNCQACTDDVSIIDLVLVANQPLCLECFNRGIKPEFERAFRNEIHHPVTYNGTILSIDDFQYVQGFYPKAFIVTYKFKLDEYAVPVPLRLYCNHTRLAPHPSNRHGVTTEHCNRFLGSKEVPSSKITSLMCTLCSTPDEPVHVCIKCSNSFSGKPTAHTCAPAVNVDDAFKGLTRGVEYQICPNERCGTRVELSEACNSMTCSLCSTSFCYICGEVPEPGHFNVGKPCPHWGQEGSPRAVFDDPAAEGDGEPVPRLE